MTDQEFVELLLAQGVQGRIGKLEAQECVYNYQWACFVPYMSDQWQGKEINISSGLTWYYGDASTPYFLCYPDKAGDSGSTTDMAGFSVGVRLTEDNPGEIVARCVVNSFHSDGSVIQQDTGWGINLMDTDLIEGPFITPIAGYDDNNGQYFYDFALTGVERKWLSPTEYEDVNMELASFSLVAGNSLTYWGTYWASDQEIIPDDGVTPTGGSGGGGGDYARYDETVAIPSLPTTSITDLGVSNLYHVTNQQLKDFSAYLWSDNFFNTILKNFDSPMENIISLSMIPEVNFNEASAEIVIGNASSGCQGKKLFTNFYELDMGMINVNEYYKNFADYDTKIEVYLPYIGIRDIPVDACMSGYVKVVYHVDVFSGSCVAFIQTQVGKGAWHVISTFNGNIASGIPLSGANFMGMYQGMIGAIGSAVSGNVVGMASSLTNAKPSYQRTGNIGAMVGALSIRYPYLIFTTPQVFTAKTFKENRGYISNLSGYIKNFSGFLQCDPDKLDLSELVMLEEERKLLYEELTTGIYIKGAFS